MLKIEIEKKKTKSMKLIYNTTKKKTKYNAQCPRQPNIWKIRLKKKLKKEKKIGLVKSKIEKKN
jgi:hypothetical protein